MRISFEKVTDAVNYINNTANKQPKIGLILGSGLGELAEQIEDQVVIDYGDIPHFPQSTVVGHAGKLVLGKLADKQVVAMQGRFHYYEGYSMEEVTFPVRMFKQLGVEQLLVTNACGGMRPQFSPGDLMIITDHLNMTGTNPLIGQNDDRFGPRFPDMSTAYTPHLIKRMLQVAEKHNIQVQKGVYAGITGPNYMTAAELIMLRKLGGDVVGMSTVPEVIVARHMNMEVMGISCITDMAIGEEIDGISHDEVIEVANKAKPIFMKFVKEILNEL